MQLGLSIDGEPVSGTLRSWSKFHQRDIWQWCQELLGDVPPGHVARDNEVQHKVEVDQNSSSTDAA
ncbi:uncharacterized protein DS421_14g474000 [Arachis hypogaea]|nr:uncharacterized protein DS421_14g474000 [Arachis hypogaea]